MNKPRLHIPTLLLLLLPLSLTSQTVDGTTGRKTIDSRVREYLSPQRILWTSHDDATLINLDRLLLPGNGQADLVGDQLCIINGDAQKTPAFLLDFGKELHGGLEIVCGMYEGKEPITVRVTMGESVSEAMSSIVNSSATNDHAMRAFELKLPWLGKIEIGNSGFRFVRIELLDTDRQLKLKEVRAISVYRDIPYIGSFQSNDTLLNKIWATGAYTVHLNMQEFLWDGIKRDRLVWVGDMHPEVMTILSVFGANEVVPKSLDLIKSITKLPDWMNGISSYSMWWILIQHQWYLSTADKAYLLANRDYIYALLEVLQEKIDADGKEKLDGHRFLDWPTSPNPEAIHAGLQAMLVMTFEAAIEIADILGDRAQASNYRATVARLKQHIPDPNENKSGAALLAISGLEPPKLINERYLAVNPLEGISTFYGYYVLEARALAGDYQGAMDVIRTYWGAMLDLGATTFWEDFDLSWTKNAGRIDAFTPPGKVDVHATYGNYSYKGLRNSLCHGWASGPTSWLSRHVLGVEVLEPGCRKVRINPHLGDLQWVEGSYPTPYGPIHLKHVKLSDGTVESVVLGPPEVEIVK